MVVVAGALEDAVGDNGDEGDTEMGVDTVQFDDGVTLSVVAVMTASPSKLLKTFLVRTKGDLGFRPSVMNAAGEGGGGTSFDCCCWCWNLSRCFEDEVVRKRPRPLWKIATSPSELVVLGQGDPGTLSWLLLHEKQSMSVLFRVPGLVAKVIESCWIWSCFSAMSRSDNSEDDFRLRSTTGKFSGALGEK